MLGVAFGMLVMGALFLAFANPPAESPEDHAARLSRKYGLIVGFGDPSTFYTPPFGPKDAKLEDVRIDAARHEDVSPALDGIEESLAKYPPGFYASVAHGIFICGHVRFDGIDSGGTFGPAWILLAAPPLGDRERIRLISLRGVHHEFSSLVLRRDPTTYGRWLIFSPSGWQFASDYKTSLARNESADPPLSTGFLSAYGATTPENDFNIYAEKMFTEPAKIARLAREYPLIARKVAFVVSTYAAIDPRMRNTFRALGLGALVSEAPDAGAGSPEVDAAP